MIERLGVDHEQRGANLLRQALTGLRGPSAHLLAWLDLDEVTALMLGGGPEGRGKLLNGLMDYDNLDHVARFLQAAELGEPSYDPRALARELRPMTSPGQEPYVALHADAEAQAHAWLADRRRIYRYLGAGERNLAMRVMLRKAMDLTAQANEIAPSFFDATDAHALWLLRSGGSAGAAALVEAVTRDHLYTLAWEATVPEENDTIADLFAHWASRLAIEARVATEAALLPHEVALCYVVARGERPLPPVITPERGRAEPLRPPVSLGASPVAHPQERSIRLFVPGAVGRDYVRRARMAAERALGALGAVPSVGIDLH